VWDAGAIAPAPDPFRRLFGENAMKRSVVLLLLLGLMAAPIAAQKKITNYGVTVTADKNTDFTKLKTYVWESGWQAIDKNAHKQIVAAIDRELGALGFEKKDSGPADVVLTYAAIRRTDVDLKSKPTQGDVGRRSYEAGTLVVLLLEPGTRKELFRARGDEPIEADPEKLQAVIDTMVADMFAKYPTRTRK
jgi:hypothetical protein